MKPYIKGKYRMITTISLCDNYFLVVIIQSEYHIRANVWQGLILGKFPIRKLWQVKRW